MGIGIRTNESRKVSVTTRMVNGRYLHNSKGISPHDDEVYRIAEHNISRLENFLVDSFGVALTTTIVQTRYYFLGILINEVKSGEVENYETQ